MTQPSNGEAENSVDAMFDRFQGLLRQVDGVLDNMHWVIEQHKAAARKAALHDAAEMVREFRDSNLRIGTHPYVDMTELATRIEALAAQSIEDAGGA